MLGNECDGLYQSVISMLNHEGNNIKVQIRLWESRQMCPASPYSDSDSPDHPAWSWHTTGHTDYSVTFNSQVCSIDFQQGALLTNARGESVSKISVLPPDLTSIRRCLHKSSENMLWVELAVAQTSNQGNNSFSYRLSASLLSTLMVPS